MDEPAPGLSLQLLGPFQAQTGGRPLPRLHSRKALWALALLVLRHEREVRRDWLASTLWPESEESLALRNLREVLTDLRAALGAEANRLLSPTARTLRLELKGAEVDLVA